MKLQDKKTGEIWTLINRNEGTSAVIWVTNGSQTQRIESIEELTSRFEDYKEPKAYYIGRCGTIEEFDPTKDVALTEMLKEIGNCFSSKEEAEKAVEKLKAWKRLKDRGFKVDLWDYDGGNYQEKIRTGRILFRVADDYPEKNIDNDLDLLFGGEE